MMVGFVCVSFVTTGSLLNGLAMCMVGLLLGSVGTDVNSGLQRFTMDLPLLADGVGIVTENLYPGRFRYVEELQRLGADIRADGHHAVVRGVPLLSGAPVRAPDIRAGAALVVAGLAADGETSVTGVHHVDRGYDDLVGRLAALGADIERVPAG